MVVESFDGQVLEALLSVDGAPDEVKHRVKDICRTASKVDTNKDISGWLIELGEPLIDSFSTALRPARVQLLAIKLDGASHYVLGRFVGEFRLVRHSIEWLIIDKEDEFVRQCIVIKHDFPL